MLIYKCSYCARRIPILSDEDRLKFICDSCTESVQGCFGCDNTDSVVFDWHIDPSTYEMYWLIKCQECGTGVRGENINDVVHRWHELNRVLK